MIGFKVIRFKALWSNPLRITMRATFCSMYIPLVFYADPGRDILSVCLFVC